MDTIIDYKNIQNLAQELKGKKIVFAGGCFDIVHIGHVEFLKRAKEEGDVLIIALESDEFIQKRKKKHPVHTQIQRAEVLSAIRYVDYVILLPYLQTDDEYRALVHAVRPQVIAITEGDRFIKQKTKQADEIGAVVRAVCPPLASFSSSNIVAYETIFSD